MTRFPPGGATYDELCGAVDLPAGELDFALRQLTAHSMVSFDPNHGQRYTIHRLTYIFLWALEVERTAPTPETIPLYNDPAET